MQNITLDEIQPGMYLSKALISNDGTVLLHEGIEMKERYIQYLRNKGITSLFVGEPDFHGIADVKEYFYDQGQRQAAVEEARSIVAGFQAGKGIKLDGVKNIVSDMVAQLSRNPGNMLHLLDLRRKEEYMFSHAVNTCVLAVMAGLALGYERKQLDELGLAAMLHDIGMTKLPPQLARQFPRDLAREEKEEYRRHPFYSLEILRKNPTLSNDVINACFQHHERWNGSGYPMGIAGNAISEYAQIIGIADVYDRLIVGLPHRLATPVYYAVAILNKAAGQYFNPAMIEKFNQSIAIYPMGKAVRLNNQQCGVILGVSLKNKNTPVVRIIADDHLNRPPLELDLSKNPELFIIDFEERNFSYTQNYADQAYVVHTKRPPV
ncbi:HD-GYP domain, c-di-GMP phosphodiesterase class II (or its inactivated variant) [Dendrosporobacter quercicolus]|uniref:HD-GYP domain, c-di-GMP phosphodiesterase class II (Or its inactivated variant) n=1 Tax=Dendrosporobacter quercicolus TaxID=146817 RepID=A0A1G9SH66_9FIRM|nr:HD-GYP domain-containing protein [Dendrosporobacter quercicolus]SDM34813.1 HD-GYP domain, c-di-GMP phosphodiesterase class II (or its inactivated variant) [Dendrosporobacter quercicolus]